MRKKLIALAVFLVLFAPFGMHGNLPARADDLATTCQQISDANNSCSSMSSSDCRALLEKCAKYYDDQSAAIAEDLTKTKAQKDTLQNQVSSLKKKITSLESQINQGTLMVKDLNLQITDTQGKIDKTTSDIGDSQNQIANILQTIYKEDQKPSFVVLLEGSLADFFGNIAYLESLNSRVSDLLESTKNLQSYLQGQRDKMDGEKTQLQSTIKIQTLAKKENEQNKAQQETYLQLTEAQYQQQQSDKAAADKKAAVIKSRLFDLLGVPSAPTFEQAYNIAKYVEGVTGVRAAFLLAILTQESNLGKNVGQCYLKNQQTGDGVNIKTGNYSPKTMNPKSIPTFIDLINQINQGKGLARDPFATPVSCVIYYNGKPYGWGGAMGPSQFIASTWVGLGYGQKVTNITGKVADPWDIRDAFIATGFLLKDSGAASGSTNAEFNAAMKYYCGGSCSSYDKFYGRSVVNIANGYAADIAAISG